MTKTEYIQYRTAEHKSKYTMHTSARNEVRICLSMEMGKFPHPVKKIDTSWSQAIIMLLACCFTKDEIDNELKRLFPALSNTGRTNRILQIFTNNKCKNVSIYKEGAIIGLKWERFKFFDVNDNWNCIQP